MYDYHVHTDYSLDSKMKMDTACAAAVAAGVKEIAFTEHLDLHYPNSDQKWSFEIPTYQRDIKKMREKWGNKLAIRSGIEVGMHPRVNQQSREFVQKGHFDFVIGSVHIVGDLDLYDGSYFREKSDEEAVMTWYENLYARVREYTDFDVLGHLDLIRRYQSFMKNPAGVDWYSCDDLIDEILKEVIESDRGIEVNLSGWRSGLDAPMPDLRIIQRYRELHGEVITVGSDAHTPEWVGQKLDYGYYLLRQAGYRYVTIYRERKPDFIPLRKLINY